MSILSVSNLTKKFTIKGQSFTAVNDVSFELKEGEILGFLGPNGAGKTTTIQMLLGITIPTLGMISYFGKDFFQHKPECLQKINYASAFNTLQGRISVWENLMVFANLYQIPDPKKKIYELVKYFDMEDLLNTRYWNLSTGQRTRTNIMKALINDPRIILMDEPTASLDPDIADKTLTFIEKLKNDGRLSILYTSHNMAEITRICDRVIILDKGKIVAQDTPLGLTKRIESAQLILTFDGENSQVESYLIEEKHRYEFPKEHVVVVHTEEKLIPKIIFGISKKGIWITDIEVKKPTLEDVFLQIARGKSHVFQ